MRLRHANIRLINRRSNLPRLLLALSSINGQCNDNSKNNPTDAQGLTGHSISDLLKPNGMLSIVTPNFGSFGSMIYGEDWYPLQPPTHLVLFTPNALSQCLKAIGFKTVTTHRSSFGGNSIHHASEQLKAEGRFSNHELPLTSRLLKKWSSLLAYFSLRASEEIVITARR